MPPVSGTISMRRRRSCRALASERPLNSQQNARPAPPEPQSAERKRATLPQVIRFALDGDRLPSVLETLPLAESTRRVLMGIYARLHADSQGPTARSPVLSGKDAEGRPLRGHGHAYFLPSDEDGDGLLECLTIVAEHGFDDAERTAFDRFRGMRFITRARAELRLHAALVGMGALDDYHPALIRPSTAWVSATPFIATRFPKPRGRKRDPHELLQRASHNAFVQKVLEEELERMRRRRPDMPAPIRITALCDEDLNMRIGSTVVPLLRFARRRRKAEDDGHRRLAGAFRIEFPEPLRGPLALGWSSHYGMGLFLPEAADAAQGAGLC